jgi:hypothetical protein
MQQRNKTRLYEGKSRRKRMQQRTGSQFTLVDESIGLKAGVTPEAQFRQRLINHLAKIGFTLDASDNHTLLFVRRGIFNPWVDSRIAMERLLYVTVQSANNTTFVKAKAELSIKGEATNPLPTYYPENFALEAAKSVKQ